MSGKKMIAAAVSAIMVCSLSFPSLAFASVKVDETELAQGENAVGGGTATLAGGSLDMAGVTAKYLYTDESLNVNFNGGNDLESAIVAGSAEVEMNFSGDNEVEDITASDQASVTINANGYNDFEEVTANDNSNITLKVAGENSFESIDGRDNASIVVKGVTCQMRDIINLGDDESFSAISTQKGKLTIDHVTINLKSESAYVGSTGSDVVIDTSKIAQQGDNEDSSIYAQGTMKIFESVIDIKGTVFANGLMTIEHSDVKVTKPAGAIYDKIPRVHSRTGIELIREKNGEVIKEVYEGEDDWRLDTGDGDTVDLKADGKPAYYKCSDSDDEDSAVKGMPKTADETSLFPPVVAAIASAALAAFVSRRTSGMGAGANGARF